jgi:hypothetical protein
MSAPPTNQYRHFIQNPAHLTGVLTGVLTGFLTGARAR